MFSSSSPSSPSLPSFFYHFLSLFSVSVSQSHSFIPSFLCLCLSVCQIFNYTVYQVFIQIHISISQTNFISISVVFIYVYLSLDHFILSIDFFLNFRLELDLYNCLPIHYTKIFKCFCKTYICLVVLAETTFLFEKCLLSNFNGHHALQKQDPESLVLELA